MWFREMFTAWFQKMYASDVIMALEMVTHRCEDKQSARKLSS